MRQKCHIVKINSYTFDKLVNATLNYSDLSGTPLNCITPLYKSIATNGFKVSIDGHGGDECLTRYPDMIDSALQICPESHKENLFNTLSSMLYNPHDNPIHKVQFSAKARIADRQVKKALSFQLRKQEVPAQQMETTRIQRNQFPLPTKVLDHRKKLKDLKTSYFGIHRVALEFERIPLILKDFDKASMLSGVEVRTPFLDYRLVEFCCNLPLTKKAKNGYTKYILRKSMDDHLPKEVVWRKHKVGINAPLQNWFENDRFRKSSQDLVREVEKEAFDMLSRKIKDGSLLKSIMHD